jgi:hypothetical protein
MRSRSSAVNRFIFARLPSVSFRIQSLGTRSLTDFETTLVLVEGSSPGSLEKAVLDALRPDEPVLQIHSSRNEIADG